MPLIAERDVSTIRTTTLPSNLAPLCQAFAPLKTFSPAQNWCQYYFPQSAATVTSTVGSQYPSPTIIEPAKPTKPAVECKNQSNVCKVYNDFLRAAGDQNKKYANAFCSCIGVTRTITIVVPKATSTKALATPISSRSSPPVLTTSSSSAIRPTTSSAPVSSTLPQTSSISSTSTPSIASSSSSTSTLPQMSSSSSELPASSSLPASSPPASIPTTPCVSSFENSVLQVQSSLAKINGQYLYFKDPERGYYPTTTTDLAQAQPFSLNVKGDLTTLGSSGVLTAGAVRLLPSFSDYDIVMFFEQGPLGNFEANPNAIPDYFGGRASCSRTENGNVDCRDTLFNHLFFCTGDPVPGGGYTPQLYIGSLARSNESFNGDCAYVTLRALTTQGVPIELCNSKR